MVVRIIVFGIAEQPKGILAEIVGSNLLHTKTDEIVVFCGEISSEERSIFKASLWCEDRLNAPAQLLEK